MPTNLTILRQNQGNMVTGQQPQTNTIPMDMQQVIDFMTPQVVRFRENSSPMNVMVDLQTLAIGQTKQFRIQSTGLGERIIHKITVSIALVNADTNPQAVSFSKEFPYSLLPNISTSINGNTAITSASAYAYLLESARRYRSFAVNPADARTCQVTAGANITLSAGTNTVSGYSGASIAASSTGIINATFYFETPYVWNRETMLGLLPLQNSSTYAQITYQMASAMLGTDAGSPIYVASAIPSTLTYSSSGSTLTALPRYDFWAVPNNPALYQTFILNSFQIIEQSNNPLPSTGAGALKFQFPLNSYLLANTLVLRNASNALVNVNSVVSSIYMQYNSNVTPFKTDLGIHEFAQYQFYRNDWSQLGTVIWDGTATGQQVNVSDETGWVDLYSVSNPTFIADIVSGSITLPATYSLTRAQLVPADVKVVPA